MASSGDDLVARLILSHASHCESHRLSLVGRQRHAWWNTLETIGSMQGVIVLLVS